MSAKDEPAVETKGVFSLVAISLPGSWAPGVDDIHFDHHPLIVWLIFILKAAGVQEVNTVDSVLGWGNLNQDWLEFKTNVITSWHWCWLEVLSEHDNKILQALLERGDLLLQVHYIKGEDLIPHM